MWELFCFSSTGESAVESGSFSESISPGYSRDNYLWKGVTCWNALGHNHDYTNVDLMILVWFEYARNPPVVGRGAFRAYITELTIVFYQTTHPSLHNQTDNHFASFFCSLRSFSMWSISIFRYFAVYDSFVCFLISSSGVPVQTIRPPSLPPSGPTSII